MFVLLRDYLKKLEKAEKKEENKKEQNDNNEKSEKESDIKEDNLVKDKENEEKEDSSDVEESRENSDEDKKEVKKEIKVIDILKLFKRVRKKKKKKKRRKKIFTYFSLGVYIIFVIFFVSRIFLLRSPEIYELSATMKYNSEYRKYEIIYDIEELWNDYDFEVGDKVCTPETFGTYDSAIYSDSSYCLHGEVVESGNRVKIKYDLPKYISTEELEIYTKKNKGSDKGLWHVKVEIKRFLNLYQIVSIKPK